MTADSTTSGTATIPILAGIAPIWILPLLAVIGFAVVWIVSHTINVLIVLSPFGFIDAILERGKLSLLSLIGVPYLLSPLLAALLALIIIAVCAYLASSAFRLSFYVSVLSADYLRSIFWKSKPDPERIRCFLAKRGNKRLKVRTLGRVASAASGSAVFRSRRFFVGDWRSVKLPVNGTLYVTNGFLFPTLQAATHETGRAETLLHLLPRSESVAGILEVEFRETPTLRGFTATKIWLTEFLKAGRGRAIDTPSSLEKQVST